MNQNNNMVNKKKIREVKKENKLKEIVIRAKEQNKKEAEYKLQRDNYDLLNRQQKDKEHLALLEVWDREHSQYSIVETKSCRWCPSIVKSELRQVRKYLTVKTCQGPCGKGSKQILHFQGDKLYCMDCTQRLIVQGRIVK